MTWKNWMNAYLLDTWKIYEELWLAKKNFVDSRSLPQALTVFEGERKVKES